MWVQVVHVCIVPDVFQIAAALCKRASRTDCAELRTAAEFITALMQKCMAKHRELLHLGPFSIGTNVVRSQAL